MKYEAPENKIEIENIEYDFAFSFDGENREYVEKLKDFLCSKNVIVFYDRDKSLTGKKLWDYLEDIFFKKAIYSVVFVSKKYRDNEYTIFELLSAKRRAKLCKYKYILQVRFDNTELPGLTTSDSYEDTNRSTMEEIGNNLYSILVEHKKEYPEHDVIKITNESKDQEKIVNEKIQEEKAVEQVKILKEEEDIELNSNWDRTIEFIKTYRIWIGIAFGTIVLLCVSLYFFPLFSEKNSSNEIKDSKPDIITNQPQDKAVTSENSNKGTGSSSSQNDSVSNTGDFKEDTKVITGKRKVIIPKEITNTEEAKVGENKTNSETRETREVPANIKNPK